MLPGDRPRVRPLRTAAAALLAFLLSLAASAPAAADPAKPLRAAESTGRGERGRSGGSDSRAESRADSPASDRKPPLSAEDAHLLRELALLEQLEVVRHLDLLEAAVKEGAPAEAGP
jgi:opacity protein-like surface antigen